MLVSRQLRGLSGAREPCRAPTRGGPGFRVFAECEEIICFASKRTRGRQPTVRCTFAAAWPEDPPRMYERLLVPIDGGELTDRAIEASIELAAQLRAAIVGFTVEPSASKSKRAPVDEEDADDRKTPLDLKRSLAHFATAAAAAGVAFQGVTHPATRIDKAILQAAESHDCDMIVMVTHGRGPFGEFLFGSQTKAVLAGSRLPILILK
ncbi:MAG: universal stress protein [Burkholderiales bacterium]|nr:universal stress protein [Burkholderiales bacterium]